jgi:acyl-CoA thioesterase 11
VSDTLTTSMQIVFPQHTNSHGLIFGGNTMSWSEEVALLACRKIRVSDEHCSLTWKTVAMDGLEFNVQVVVGDLMMLSAVVIQTYAHSCEVYVLAQAEDRQGRRRITNDVLFTLAYDVLDDDDDNEGKERSHITSQIVMPAGSALQSFQAVSPARRMERLELRQMLVRVYGG